MSNVLISTICHRCNHKTPEMWVTRNHRQEISLEGAVCGQCGGRNCVGRDWQAEKAGPLIPPAEDGNINRLEVSYRDENGKQHVKKIDPKSVEKHLKANER